MCPKGESTDAIVEDYIDLVSNFPSELRFNLESIRDADSQVKRMIDNLRKEALAYLKRTNEIATAVDSPSLGQTCASNHKFSQKLTESLKHRLGSEDRARIILDTPDNDARISLLNYYEGHKNALREAEREVTQVKQALEALNAGHTRLSAILPSSRKKTTSYPCGYKQSANLDRSSEPSREVSVPFNTYGLKRRHCMKSRVEKHRKDAPCSKDEVLYCICRQVSYGDMVGCDNENCEIEWFHYKCVGLTSSPKGAWYCDPCIRKLGLYKKN